MLRLAPFALEELRRAQGIDPNGVKDMTDLYQSQRAMRHMRKAALQRGVIAILDVGTSKIACLILRFDGLEETREQRRRGARWRASRISG